MESWISEVARRRVVVLAIAAVVNVALGALSPARAQRPAPSDEARASARRELVAGVAALKKGDYQAALARFEAAYAIVPSPKIQYDFGLAYDGLGRTTEALAAFERFLAEATDAPPDKRDKAAERVATLREQIAQTSGRSDRDVAGTQPAAPPPATLGAPPGSRSAMVDAELAEYRDDETTVATTTTTAAAPDSLRAWRITGISVGAAGIGLIAAGLVVGALASRESDSLTHDSQIGAPDHPTPFDPGKESRGLAYQKLEIVGLVAGAVAVAAGTIIYATTRRVAIEPAAGNALAGATLRVTF
jgi:hypothetical protein